MYYVMCGLFHWDYENQKKGGRETSSVLRFVALLERNFEESRRVDESQ